MENNEDDMIFTVATPAGKAYADFTIADEPVKWSGDPLALRFIAAVFDVKGFTGYDGHSLSMNALDPEEFYNFCNSAENGMIIIPPFSYLEYVAEQERADVVFDSLADAAKAVNTSPTEAQKEAGNYAKGFVTLHGLKAVIENPKGSTRSGIDANGKPWKSTMNAHYGYFSGSEGADGDHVDVFFGDDAESDNPRIFIVNQNDAESGDFDEHKVMFGYADIESAKKAYLGNYEKGWKGLGSIKETTLEKFKEWLFSEKTKITFDRLFIESEIRARGAESFKFTQKNESLYIRHHPVIKVAQDDYDDGIQDLIITHEDGVKFAAKREWDYEAWGEYDKINESEKWNDSKRYQYIIDHSKLIARKELKMNALFDSVDSLRKLVFDSSLDPLQKMEIAEEIETMLEKIAGDLDPLEQMEIAERVEELLAMLLEADGEESRSVLPDAEKADPVNTIGRLRREIISETALQNLPIVMADDVDNKSTKSREEIKEILKNNQYMLYKFSLGDAEKFRLFCTLKTKYGNAEYLLISMTLEQSGNQYVVSDIPRMIPSDSVSAYMAGLKEVWIATLSPALVGEIKQPEHIGWEEQDRILKESNAAHSQAEAQAAYDKSLIDIAKELERGWTRPHSKEEVYAEIERTEKLKRELQKVGTFEREFDGFNGRRTAPAVAAEGARNAADRVMKLNAYLEHLDKQQPE